MTPLLEKAELVSLKELGGDGEPDPDPEGCTGVGGRGRCAVPPFLQQAVAFTVRAPGADEPGDPDAALKFVGSLGRPEQATDSSSRAAGPAADGLTF